jgi:fatty acid synthase
MKQLRNEPLLVGSVKSNMGHTEPASGLCSLAKVLLAIHSGIISPNLHFETPDEAVPALAEGRLRVVTEPTPLPPNKPYIVILNNGFGGSNSVAILALPPQSAQMMLPTSTDDGDDSAAADGFPRILLYAGRTADALKHFLGKAAEHPGDPHLHRLLYRQACTINR